MEGVLRMLVDWIPFLVFVGVLIYFMRKGVGGKQAEYMQLVKQYHDEHLEETRKIQASLERIAVALERSAPANQV
jgi:ATP-dependent Zn protease